MNAASRERYFSALEDEATRLRIEAQQPYSEFFLSGLGLRDGLQVAEVGCGSGHIACWLATQVGPSGRVIGYDLSPWAITAASEVAQHHQLTNIEFIERSVFALPERERRFDLVYSRLLLDDLPDKTQALRLLSEQAKPGGVLACEMMDMYSSYCHPRSPAFDRLVELYLTFAKEHRGSEQDFAQNLFIRFQDLGLEAVRINLVQPVFHGPRLKHYMALMVKEFIPPLLKMGMTTEAEGERLTAAIEALVQDNRCVMAGGRMFQVAGRLPQATIKS